MTMLGNSHETEVSRRLEEALHDCRKFREENEQMHEEVASLADRLNVSKVDQDEMNEAWMKKLQNTEIRMKNQSDELGREKETFEANLKDLYSKLEDQEREKAFVEEHLKDLKLKFEEKERENSLLEAKVTDLHLKLEEEEKVKLSLEEKLKDSQFELEEYKKEKLVSEENLKDLQLKLEENLFQKKI